MYNLHNVNKMWNKLSTLVSSAGTGLANFVFIFCSGIRELKTKKN